MEHQPDVTQRKPPGFRTLHSFRWSLRTMFVVVALAACWLAYEANWIRQRREVVADFPRWQVFKGQPGTVMAQPSAPGLLWLFGESGYAAATLVVIVDDSMDPLDESSLPVEAKGALERAAQLFPEAVVEPAIVTRSQAGPEFEELMRHPPAIRRPDL